MKEAVRFFDKDLVRRAHSRSYRNSMWPVDGLRNACVPRESVYDTELMRILTNWLAVECYIVTGQWRLVDKTTTGRPKHGYSDIVIKKANRGDRYLESAYCGNLMGSWRRV